MSDQPGYTRIPNALLELLPSLPDAECRVLLVIVRKTLGWQKACDVISYSQLRDATGMSQQGVINGVEAAIKRGILKREPSGHNNGFCYEILADQVVNEVDHLDKQSTKQTSQRSRPLVVNEVDHLPHEEKTAIQGNGTPKNGTFDTNPSSQRSRHTKEIDLKERERKDRAPRKRADAPADRTPHQQIMDAYASSLGYAIRDGPKEGNAARWLVKNGYTAEQVQACFFHLRSQAFWRDKHISLQTVASQIGAYLQSKNGHTNGKPIRSNTGQNPERARWSTELADEL